MQAGGLHDVTIGTSRPCPSLQLLVKLQRPVLDLSGEELVEGWQPGDLPDIIARQEQSLQGRGWPDAYSFGRVNSPRP